LCNRLSIDRRTKLGFTIVEGLKIDVFSNTHSADWIAVVGQLRKDHGRLPLSYVEAVRAAGGRARVISTFQLLADEEVPAGLEAVTGVEEDDTSVLDGAAGLLLPGGGDIDPTWYGSEAHPLTTRISHRRDQFELNLLRVALERDIPILGICHGMQLLNVYFGGTLDQHLSDDPGRINHDAGLPNPKPVHGISVEPSRMLAEVSGVTGFEVNSHHHPGVDRLGKGLDPIAWSNDGVLEGFAARDYSWVVAVQWHPEAMAADALQQRLFAAFVEATRTYAARSTTDERATA
jgi:putative glutamine amidotransferase